MVNYALQEYLKLKILKLTFCYKMGLILAEGTHIADVDGLQGENFSCDRIMLVF